MTNERIYCITDTETARQWLRIATHPSQALKSVVSPRYTVHTASAIETATLMKSGVQPIHVEEPDVIAE